MASAKPDIFTYLNYRKFFRDMVEYKKQTEKNFSFRELSRQAGFSSPNLPQLIIQGKRHLDQSGTFATASALGLSKLETDFFELLVNFERARNHEEKERYFKKIVANSGYKRVKPIEKSKYQYFEQWYNPVVFELSVHQNFDGTPGWLVQRIFPRITLTQAENALKLIEKLGLIVKDTDSGKWKQTMKTISTESETSYLATATYHKNLIKLASKSIDSFRSKERAIRGVTMRTSPEKYALIQKKMEKFWNELLEISEMPDEGDDVCQVNLQLFPLTKKLRGRHD